LSGTSVAFCYLLYLFTHTQPEIYQPDAGMGKGDHVIWWAIQAARDAYSCVSCCRMSRDCSRRMSWHVTITVHSIARHSSQKSFGCCCCCKYATRSLILCSIAIKVLNLVDVVDCLVGWFIW